MSEEDGFEMLKLQRLARIIKSKRQVPYLCESDLSSDGSVLSSTIICKLVSSHAFVFVHCVNVAFSFRLILHNVF